MIRINIHEAKARLSHYARLVKSGQTVILCDRNQPFAEWRPLHRPEAWQVPARPLGVDAGRVTLPEDWDSPATNQAVAALFGIEP